MDPSVIDLVETNGQLTFTISNINVSFANGLRRVILSDIPTVIIRTSPHEKNDVDLQINTTILNNEIIKQRLSCIPIYISDTSINISDYVIEVHVKNTSEQTQYVTTKDFKIKNITTNKYLNDEITQTIFPPNSISKQYIDVCRLRPQISDNFNGDELKFTAKLSLGTANENGSFTVVSTCSYSNTLDVFKIAEQKEIKINKLREQNITEEQIVTEIKDWENLDAKRIYIEDSFSYTIKSIGVFTNNDIVLKAIKITIERLQNIIDIYSKSNSLITETNGTINNSYDIKLENEDYTIGKILEYTLYINHYKGDNTINFCGFNKPHPHVPYSIIRLGFNEDIDKNRVAAYIVNSAEIAIKVYEKLLPNFGELTPTEKIAINKSMPTV